MLNLSTIWDMTEVCRTQSLRLSAEPTDIDQIRQYAIHWLSTNVTLSPIEMIFLARAHRVGAWLDEGVTSLLICDPMPTLEDLAAFGWETAARFLWMRCNFHPKKSSSSQYTLRFRRDAVTCFNCSSSLIHDPHGVCGHIASGLGDAEFTFSGSASPILGTCYISVPLTLIKCATCSAGYPFSNKSTIRDYGDWSCDFCRSASARVSTLNTVIEEMFGEKIKD